MLEQEDVFFHVPTGASDCGSSRQRRAESIYYERSDQAGPRQSRYLITPVAQPAGLREILAAALGIRGIVRKHRRLYLVGQTRIHLDGVEGLGRFVELEVVLRPEQTPEEGQRIAADLMARLGIATEDLVEKAYVDLLGEQERQ